MAGTPFRGLAPRHPPAGGLAPDRRQPEPIRLMKIQPRVDNHRLCNVCVCNRGMMISILIMHPPTPHDPAT